MAWDTSKLNVNKLFFIVLLQFEAAVKWHVTGNNDFASDYVFSAVDILHIVKQSCFVGVSRQALQPVAVEDARVYTGLRKAFADEENVVIGLIDIENFLWPSGSTLAFDENQSVGDTVLSEIFLFPKTVYDRTCLSTGIIGKKEPVPQLYNGIKTVDILVEFINQKCNCYRTKGGYLSIEGLHRREILNSLFHVQNVTDVDMERLMIESGSAFCFTDSCEDERIKKAVLRNQKSKEIPKSQSLVRQHNALDFRDTELRIEKCEQSTVPSKEEFFHKYLKLSKPVVFKNAIHHWTAMKKWTNEYFKTNYGDNTVHIKLTPLGEFEGVDAASNFKNHKDFRIPHDVKEQLLFPDLVIVRPATTNMNFSTFLDTVESVANGSRTGFSAYLEYSSIADTMPELEEDVTEMPFIQNLLKLKHLNIWLSDGNTLGKLHFDPFDNLLCQISGRKQVILFDPHENTRLYEAHIPEALLGYNETSKTFSKKQLVDSTSMVMSPVDIINPDFERYPLFSKAHPLNCTIDEGDVLFMPAFWWHEVQSYPNVGKGRNLAVNFWYEPFLQKEFPCQECKLDVNPNYRHLL